MKFILIIISLIGLNTAYCLSQDSLVPVNFVDLDRYLGKWYEIARFDQKFQKDCTAVSATYSLRKDGDINVKNECRLNSPSGKHKVSYGRAWVTDKETNSKLKVQFFLKTLRIPLLAGNYWILALGNDYEYAIIGDNSRKYLWFLSRTSQMSNDLYEDLLNQAKSMGFDTSKLIKTPH